MFQQLFVNKHYRLRDSKLAEWRSASGDRQNDKKKINNNMNRARPMAARLISIIVKGEQLHVCPLSHLNDSTCINNAWEVMTAIATSKVYKIIEHDVVY